MIIGYAWTSDKKMRPCPFCGKKNTFCTIETSNIRTTDKKPIFIAVVNCHICGCSVYKLDADKEKAANLARNAWEHRAGDGE